MKVRYARSKDDGERFVIYGGEPPGPYLKLVLSVNESYALADALRRYHEERERLVEHAVQGMAGELP